MPRGVGIQRLDEETAKTHESDLIALLEDAVRSGASVGWTALTPGEAEHYWRSILPTLDGPRVLLGALYRKRLVGSVQLNLEQRQNGRHRAEVAKLMVRRSHRRRGIGRTLMEAVEREAHRLGRMTLVLDTRQGDPSEELYRSLGWQLVGSVPRYATAPLGSDTIEPSAFYYKLLDWSDWLTRGNEAAIRKVNNRLLRATQMLANCLPVVQALKLNPQANASRLKNALRKISEIRADIATKRPDLVPDGTPPSTRLRPALDTLNRELSRAAKLMDGCCDTLRDVHIKDYENIMRIGRGLSSIFETQNDIYDLRPDLAPEYLKDVFPRKRQGTPNRP